MNAPIKRTALVALAVVAIFVALGGPSRAGVGQIQRDQIQVGIQINVTPAPLGYVPPDASREDSRPSIVARFTLRAHGSAASFDSGVLSGSSVLVAQQTQSAVKVEAEVSPNPNATLLFSNNPGVILTGTAGTTITQSCAYTVTVHTTQTNWTLKDGLSGNPSSSSTSFPGSGIVRNNYLSTPQPTASPFTVFPAAWQNVATNNGIKTYCVDLAVSVPVTTPGGTYTTNAVYTVFW